MPAAFTFLDGRQAFVLCTSLLIGLSVAAFMRVLSLSSRRESLPFLGVLGVWIFINVVTLTINTESKLYFRIYVSVTPFLWLLYLLAARNVYQKVFSRYPGIATTGKLSLYAGGIAAAAAFLISLLFPGSPISASGTLHLVTTVDQCLLCGLSLFLLVLLWVMSRYPISIKRNVAVHCLVFNAIFFTQALFLALDQLTSFRHALRINSLAAASAAICCLAWAVFVNKRGDELVVRLRTRINPTDETRLLNQLDSLNAMLSGSVRK